MRGVERRLPDGSTTRSAKRYVSEWRAFGALVVEALGPGAYVFAYDPGVCVHLPGGRSLSIDGHVARVLANQVKIIRQLRAEADSIP